MNTPKQTNTVIELGKLKLTFAEKDKPWFKIATIVLVTLPIIAVFIFLILSIPYILANSTAQVISGIGISAFGITKAIKLIILKQ